ncbi:30S ribosomal protein S17 [Candidatus Woesebacteria bacterium RIFCSPLOWO2_01_FULL_39_23]|uniref:Small ribosomal subunit protein uS17 n=3 Tax=Microgenomates group TaxID=1794810 RepID=A0A0H4TC16_9BACT|nr:30S ribosomal protein S17, small subunit ribosomal protein S17 [uncultured Microgenomates bacterium Rifle_16ft_4_minimus_37633]AKQ05541.1 30S ribosomal protein S17, small subunit ribosomal protein S17 [uncultured Microgenomates bacterium Rifle_16ft_4_minimus_24053]OGM13883.1 MAG: 30S ribosomal protein S17 [Candidatus Woesebacteria bacterium RBG_16_40_11]OGM27835.1 MAG: 30S ribosomal protein S17 [Candidatus Woesebacteria bacterium RIFCSPHIGHO2_01_FULL_40_22]OGM36298.1 MAG: 30S ribosomal prote
MKIFTGKVVSKKMAKTATVLLSRPVIHKLYMKRFVRAKKYHVHDELGAEVGQMVNFVSSKPYSKSKKWKIVKIIGKTTAEKSAKEKAIKERGSTQSKSARSDK